MRAASAIIQVMIQAAQQAARNLRRDFGELENLQVALKGPADFVSRADKRAEETLFYHLSKARPDYGFLMEEGGEVKGQDELNRWIIDPLDGTTNFLHGIPFFSISIALERQGVVIAGVVHNPISGEIYFAQKGGGSFLNDARLRVAKRQHLSQAVIATPVPHMGHDEASRKKYLDLLGQLSRKTSGLRSLGSAALELAFVAAGRFDGCVGGGLSWWDMAAGQLLVSEAGGMVGSFAGDQRLASSGNIVAGNAAIYAELLGNL